jgi:hypothetical protein
MATMREGMARMLRGEAPPPAAATLIGMALTRFGDGEASSPSPSTTAS